MKKIVLAYSGGLDTSIILKWLQENYKAEIIAYTSDIGQVIDKKKIIKNAKRLGVKTIVIEDLKNVFKVFNNYFLNSKSFCIFNNFFFINHLTNVRCISNNFCFIVFL